jgi:hypothetical protein
MYNHYFYLCFPPCPGIRVGSSINAVISQAARARHYKSASGIKALSVRYEWMWETDSVRKT